ncbi:MAG: DUF1934 domain-containing protein [Eubacterium sp.]|nr:DUF1934 domain-containing protein [Eubacterium sp.]
MTQKAVILIKSTVDGEQAVREYRGEYRYKNGAHNFVYTDYAGNAVTKNAVEATPTQMLLHRSGAISGDMLFDPLTDTVTRYDAFMVTHGFLVHTYQYTVKEEGNQILIDLKYGLNDSTAEEICGEQNIAITLGEAI